MKKVILFLFCFIVVKPIYAEYISNGIIWVSENDLYATTKDNATMFLCEEDIHKYTSSKKREVKPYITYTQKKLRKSTNIKVMGLTNSKRSIEYDTYVVIYKEKMYYLPNKFVLDNSYLDSINSKLIEEHNALKIEISQLNFKIDSLINSYKLTCKDSILFFNELEKNLQYKIDSVKINSFNDWYTNLPQRTKYIYDNVISNLEVSLKEPNSAGGCDLYVYYTNKSTKTIKYFRFFALFYNRVNDLVRCDVRKDFSISGKETGPIETMKNGGGKWECVIYNQSASKAELNSIDIDYMDGSTESIKSSDINLLLEEPDLYRITYELNTQKSSTSKKIEIWSKRLENLEKNNFSRDYINDDPEHINILNKLKAFKTKRKSTESTLKWFEYYNLLGDDSVNPLLF